MSQQVGQVDTLFCHEDGVEPSLAVRDGRDPDVVAVLVTEQSVDLPDLL